MIVNLHKGCGGQVKEGICSECGEQLPPEKIFAFDDPLLPCKTCKRDEKKGHHPLCKAAEKRMRTGECCLMQNIIDRDGPPVVACFGTLEADGEGAE